MYARTGRNRSTDKLYINNERAMQRKCIFNEPHFLASTISYGSNLEHVFFNVSFIFVSFKGAQMHTIWFNVIVYFAIQRTECACLCCTNLYWNDMTWTREKRIFFSVSLNERVCVCVRLCSFISTDNLYEIFIFMGEKCGDVERRQRWRHHYIAWWAMILTRNTGLQLFPMCDDVDLPGGCR